MNQPHTDKFSHRQESYTASELQYAIAIEDMVRDNFGKVIEKTFMCVPKDKMKLEEGAIKLFEYLSSTHDFTISSGLTEPVSYYLSSNSIISCNKVFQLEDTPLAYTDENYDEEDHKELTSLQIKLTTTDIEKINELTIKITEYGFDIGAYSKSGIPVTFAFPSPKGIIYRTHSFEGIKLNSISQNYKESVITSTKEMIHLTNNCTHGLVLISGPAGTGKSYLIRAILSEIQKRQAIICTPPTHFLTEAGSLSEVASNFKKSIIVLEDIGEIVSSTSASEYLDARSNLLNFSEGFLSLLTDTVIVISFNYDLSKIDPAITRPGRCIANIVVDKLSHEQSQKLVNFDIPIREYTLAEVYEMKRLGEPLEKKSEERKMGFRR